MATRLSNPTPQFFYNGTPAAPLAGGLMYFYVTGASLVPKDTYSDNALTIPNSNPVVLSSSGVMPNVFFDGSYRVILKDKDGVQQWDRDSVNSIVGLAFGNWEATFDYGIGGANIVYASDAVYYVSIATPNIGNDPAGGLTPLYWEPFGDYVGIIPVPDIIIVNRSSNTMMALSNKGNLINATSTFTQTFDDVTDLNDGWFVWYKNNGTGIITLSSADLLDGETSFNVYPEELRLIQCNGTTFTTFVYVPYNMTLTASGNFLKAPGYTAHCGEIIGGGGAGGFSSSASFEAGGGGGGACIPFRILASDLSSTEAYVIGAAAAGRSTAGAGANGSSSTFAGMTAYGGGGGGGNAGADQSGGGGGGVLGAGDAGSSAQVLGGRPGPSSATGEPVDNMGFGGGIGAMSDGGFSAYGGGGGGGGAGNADGGNSLYGGGGGGGTGTAGFIDGGVSQFAGDGGAGGQAASGTNGVAPGGGGGGSRTGAISGDGARGELRIRGEV